jgi:hypothetical protein
MTHPMRQPSDVNCALERPVMLEGSCHCGAVHWRFDKVPESATACNCTVCRRYGALWAYGHEDEDVRVAGEARTYSRGEREIAFHFCGTCGNIVYWRGLKPNEAGRWRIGVNLRLAEPEAVASIVVDHLDGLVSWKDLPRDGRCVGDMWF